MIDLSIGVDIVSIERMENILNSQKGTRFKHRIFTGSEIAYCQNRGRNASHHFAGRFAATSQTRLNMEAFVQTSTHQVQTIVQTRPKHGGFCNITEF